MSPYSETRRMDNAPIAINPLEMDANCSRRTRREHYLKFGLQFLAVFVVTLLIVILGNIIIAGYEHLGWKFLSSFPSRFVSKAGIYPAFLGSIWLVGLAMLIAIPVSVGSAIYLEEIMPNSRMKSLLDTNLANLAAVPSLVYGILGLAIFVRFFSFDRSILSGSLTLSLLVIPIMIIACREALAAVPHSIKMSAICLGASKLQTTFHHTLPAALSGIMSGIILAVSRIIGETAPIMIIGGASYISYAPTSPMDGFSALPLQIYNWASRPQEEFHQLAAAGILLLLVVVFAFNFSAIVIRNRSMSKQRGL